MKKVLLFLGFISFNLTVISQNNIPTLNQEIINYIETVVGKRVDRGECWDLAYQALTRTGADWDKAFVFGDKINPMEETVYPGDLIQFNGVKIQYTEGNATYTETMGQHTAIVYKVLDKGVFEIAHQNTGFSGRKVGVSELNLNYIIKGKYSFYRPTKKRK